jgi:predicted lipid-binding transport protein (Tim44 family)
MTDLYTQEYTQENRSINKEAVLELKPKTIQSNIKKATQLFLSFALALVLMMTAMTAEAKRFGGGKSMGRQSSQSVQKYQPPAQQPTNSQNAPNQQNMQNNQAYNAPASKPSMFGGFGKVLAGVAAVAGLAWLASALGIQQELMGIMGMILIAFLVFALITWFKKRSLKNSQNNQMAYAGGQFGNTASNSNTYSNTTTNASTPSNAYANQNASTTGFNSDAKQNNSPFLSEMNANSGHQQNVFNSSFNAITDDRPLYARDFEQYAPQFFEDVQKLHQKGAHATLSQLLTPEMYEIFMSDLKQEGQTNPDGSATYLIRNLSARVLDSYEESNQYFLAVLYQGQFYENDWKNQTNEESQINETWQMVADKSQNGQPLVWKLAGITQMPEMSQTLQ